LKTSDKIVAVTNRDELILNDDDFKFLKETFKDRLIIYPYGGHCGNMFYSENVDVMLKYLKEGVFKYEEQK
ncbi:MAG: serine/threonine protein kinase, partial [Fusobacterium sp.]|nr:serine/threonine protein kinase [Fusobacterium sp.]